MIRQKHIFVLWSCCVCKCAVQCDFYAKLLIYFTYRLSGWKFRFDIFQVFSFQLKWVVFSNKKSTKKRIKKGDRHFCSLFFINQIIVIELKNTTHKETHILEKENRKTTRYLTSTIYWLLIFIWFDSSLFIECFKFQFN